MVDIINHPLCSHHFWPPKFTVAGQRETQTLCWYKLVGERVTRETKTPSDEALLCAHLTKPLHSFSLNASKCWLATLIFVLDLLLPLCCALCRNLGNHASEGVMLTKVPTKSSAILLPSHVLHGLCHFLEHAELLSYTYGSHCLLKHLESA